MNSKRPELLKMQAKQLLQNVKLDMILPFVLLLVLNLVACINLECCIIVFLVLPVMIASFYIYCAKKCQKTDFFLAFAVSSGLYLLGIFEFFVPLLELLPSENFIFVSLIFISVFCFYKVSFMLHNICKDLKYGEPSFPLSV